jgi:alkanesulfonate monooxygenase SsuD/methylene tetrahydromethanopterin reductase-like flavin-dependent oxidoreductase (luciferase family)
VGTPAEVVDALEIYRELGGELFAVKPPKGDDRTLDPFVDEGLPAFE